MKLKPKSQIMTLAKIIFASGLIYWLVQSGHLNVSLLQHIAEPQYLIACLLLVLINLSLLNLRWWVVLRANNFEIGYLRTYLLGLIGLFFNYAIPGSVGGDFVKAYYVAQENHTQKWSAALTVFVDRLIGIYAMVILSLVALSLEYSLLQKSTELASLWWSLLLVFIGTTFIFALVFSKTLSSIKNWKSKVSAIPGGSVIIRIYDAVHILRSRPWHLLNIFLLSLLTQITIMLFFVVVAKALGESTPFLAIAFAIPLGFIVSAIPIAPAGIGVGQVAFLMFFKIYTGQDMQTGTVGITLLQILFFVYSLIGAVYYLKMKKPKLEEVKASL